MSLGAASRISVKVVRVIRWKQITGTKYKLSDTGLVENTVTGKRLSPTRFKYPTVRLCTNGVVSMVALHRLVAEYFVPNPDNLPVVMHKDNNTQHYFADNLCWGTYSDNLASAMRDGLNCQGITVYQYKDSVLVAVHPSLSAAAKALGLANPSTGGATHIKHACEGTHNCKTLYGFSFSYAKEVL